MDFDAVGGMVRLGYIGSPSMSGMRLSASQERAHERPTRSYAFLVTSVLIVPLVLVVASFAVHSQDPHGSVEIVSTRRAPLHRFVPRALPKRDFRLLL